MADDLSDRERDAEGKLLADDDDKPGFFRRNVGAILGTGAVAGVAIGGALAARSFFSQLNPLGALTEPEKASESLVNAGIKGISDVAKGGIKGVVNFGERNRGVLPAQQLAGIQTVEGESREDRLKRERIALARLTQSQRGGSVVGSFFNAILG